MRHCFSDLLSHRTHYATFGERRVSSAQSATLGRLLRYPRTRGDLPSDILAKKVMRIAGANAPKHH
ncbi:hypothetical protein NTGM5_10009 [Candidatus Nitrotoga sp. M5]|nr:hypothetical protein NTGM5_10009 [Candidatus Nitrotoga sp. M5]